MDLYRQRIDQIAACMDEAKEPGPHNGVGFNDPEGMAHEVYVTGPDADGSYDLTVWRKGDHDSGVWASGTKEQLLTFAKKIYAATKKELKRRG